MGEHETSELEQLRAFRSAVLNAFAKGRVYCECMGIFHEQGCPLGGLEVEAERIRQEEPAK